MNGLGWKLRRLRAMSAGEVAHRVHVAVRDRWLAPGWTRLSPAAAHAALFVRPRSFLGGAGARAPRAAHARDLVRAARWLPGPDAALPAAEAEAIRARGADIARGEWTMFGHPVALPAAPDWNANALTGAAWPAAPSRTLDHHRTDVAGGVKLAWEVGRLTFLPELALAARAGEPAAAARALALLADFDARNPLGQGIHHTSGIEQAIRVANVTATLALLAREGTAGVDAATLDAQLEPALGLAAQQALWCRDHLSLGSSANNHLLAEYMALAVMGGVWASLRGAARLARAGRDGLQREVLAQFHADGVSAEQSFGYVPFLWEITVLGLRGAEVAGHEPAPAVRARLAETLEFMRAVRGPDGRAPQVGDEDDGRILLAGHPAPRLDLVGNALAAWLGVDALSNEAQAYARTLGFAPRPARTAPDGVRTWPQGGYTVWREAGLRVVLDHGPLGLGPLAAHGHADALAFTLARGLDDVVVDPGTLAYQEDEAARTTSRATPSHATVHFGGRSQSEMRGPFLWGRRASVAFADGAWRCRWWTGETHARRVEVAPGRVAIEDVVNGPDAEIVFPLPPGARATIEGGRALVESGGTVATFVAEGLGPWRLEPSLHAPGYLRRASAQRLLARFAGARARTTITLADRG